MTASITPIRQRGWTPPAYYTRFARISDGKLFEVRGVFAVDQQVRLESCSDKERVFPFGNQLAGEYRQVSP